MNIMNPDSVPPPSARGRGRPSDAEARDHRQAILAAAEERFATHGYTATSMRQIAEQVGVTPAMVHYYFGSKKGLFREVLDQALSPLAEAIAQFSRNEGNVVERFPGLLLRLGVEHPHLPALVAREVFLPGGQMQAHFIENLAPRLGGALPAILEQAQDAGHISDRYSPRILALLILAMCFFPLLARPLAEPVLGVKGDEAGLADLEAHVRLLLRRGLTP